MRTVYVSLTASVLIHAATLTSLNPGAAQYYQRLTGLGRPSEPSSQENGIQINFVESPRQKTIMQPKDTRKISDRDSIAQDPEPPPLDASTPGPQAPKMEKLGPADQLEQKRGGVMQPPVPEMKPSPEVTPTQRSIEEVLSEAQKSIQEPKAEEASEEKLEKALNDAEVSAEPRPTQKPSTFSPAQAPVPAIPGIAGRDRITTQAMSRNRSHGAQIMGETSFEAMGTEMGAYVKNMKERMWIQWFPYLAVHYPKDFQSADVLVRFYLTSEGEVRKAEVVDFKGSPLFAAYCLNVVKSAGPFGAVPKDVMDLVGNDEMEVKFGFHFW